MSWKPGDYDKIINTTEYQDAIMPHSVSGNSSPSREVEDEVLPDAPPAETSNGAVQEGGSETEHAEDVKSGVQLQDLFNDDEDDEFPASSAPDNKNGNSPTQDNMM